MGSSSWRNFLGYIQSKILRSWRELTDYINIFVKGKIALFQHHPYCSVQCCNGIIKALGGLYDIKIFTKDQVVKETFEDVDIIAFPGGLGDADKYYSLFTRRQANIIADFVDQGGCYLGICMGAYWAGHHYFDLLDDVECRQYIRRPRADIRRSYGTTASIRWSGYRTDMFFYDGTAFVGDHTKFETIATYANGDSAAIIQGRIGLIGPHPESEHSWYDKPYKYLKEYWHQGNHHYLLRNFANRLMSKRITANHMN